jgi:hypothetical protein
MPWDIFHGHRIQHPCGSSDEYYGFAGCCLEMPDDIISLLLQYKNREASVP